jgi:D-arabinose 1-dehydrogenase-like Zn-dependent alcohol dehydrogenase
LAKLDEAAELIKAAMITSSWHRAFRAAFLEAAKRHITGKVLVPYLGEVFSLGEDLRELGLEIFSYDRREDAAADAAMIGAGRVELANSACEAAKASYDSVLAFDSFYFSYDPLAELRCLVDRLRRGGKLVVANADAASLPSVAAVYLWGGGHTALAQKA